MAKTNSRWSCDISSQTSFQSTAENMASNTSMHGLPNVMRALAYFRKVFWALVLLAFVGVFVWQIVVLVGKYQGFPTSTTVKIKRATPMKFPAVTICNINPVRRAELTETHLEEIFHEKDNQTDSMNDLDWYAMENQTDFYETDEYTTAEQVTINREYASMDRNLRAISGHQLEDMLLHCSFGGKYCSPRNFTRFLNYKFGNCYVFNSGADGSDIKHIRRTGPESGLILNIYVEHQHAYVARLTDNVGIKLLIHEQFRMPFPDESGYSVSVGTKTSVSVSKVQIERMKSPHGDCVDASEEENRNLNMYYDEVLHPGYTQEACSKSCLQRTLVHECICCSYHFPCDGNAIELEMKSIGKENITMCESDIELDCERSIWDRFMLNDLDCLTECPTACSEIYYDTDMSSSMWPARMSVGGVAESLEGHSNYVETLFKNMSFTEQEKFVRENVLKLEVYFKSLNFEYIETEAAYSDVSLISDIGGQMGLWLGLSVLTLVEFLELFVDLVTIAILKTRKTGTVNHKGDETEKTDKTI